MTSSMQGIVAIYRRDPKRAGLIAAATVAMLGLSVRLMFGGPSRARAVTVPAVMPSHNLVAKSTTEFAPPRQGVDPAAFGQWLNAERHGPRRNLFAADRTSKPAPAVTADTSSQNAAEIKEAPGIWDEVAKSMAAQADQGRERQQSHLAYLRRQDLQRQVGDLRLTKIVPGPPPAACVNGALVGEGGVVALFRVLKIEPRRIIVEREGIQLEVPLN